jgi:hypothetical protein
VSEYEEKYAYSVKRERRLGQVELVGREDLLAWRGRAEIKDAQKSV